MNRFLMAVVVTYLSLTCGFALLRREVLGTPPEPDLARNPVLVELFTSEGCSSCPPADALLTRLSGVEPPENVQVIALEEHVDYWDELGWRDPFSSREWTLRQYDYAGTLRNGNPYTPQMVVDGRVEFVGSHAGKARQAILEAASKAKAAVKITQEKSSRAGKENFSVSVGKLPEPAKSDTAEVWLAVTETGLHSAVTRGENAGEDLHHAAVARNMRRIGDAKAESETSFAGSAEVPLKGEWKRENLLAVVFVQERKSRRILGVSEIRIAP